MKTHRITAALNAFVLSLLAVALSASVSVSHAAVSNVGNPNNGSFVFADNIGSVGHDAANSFTTGTTDLFLNSITVSLAGGFGSTFSVSLFSDASGLPGISLLALTGDSAPTAGGLVNYTPASGPNSFALLANTTYWAVLTVTHTAPDKQFPNYTENAHTETGDVGWSISDNYASRLVNNGTPAAWTAGPGGGASTPLQFAVNAVPEPSTVALLTAGLGALLFFRRRRSGTAE